MRDDYSLYIVHCLLSMEADGHSVKIENSGSNGSNIGIQALSPAEVKLKNFGQKKNSNFTQFFKQGSFRIPRGTEG